VVETTANYHDRMMATVQVLTHFQTQVHGLTIARLGTPLEETLRFTSPAYLMELFVAARHFAQSPDLYGAIEMRNPAAGQVTAAFREAASDVADLVARGDRDGFRRMFAQVQGFFGSFTHEALEQTSFLIDRLVERQ
jgi:chorismate mutase / prephenate dehydrogenase